MASATDTGSPETAADAPPEPGVLERTVRGKTTRPRLKFTGLPGSRLGRLILAFNLLGLAILISGALVLNELRRGLVNARIDSLSTQGELIASILNQAATVGEPEPQMDAAYATELLQTLSNPKAQRARLFDSKGRLVADSDWMADEVQQRDLPPARPRDAAQGLDLMHRPEPSSLKERQAALQREVAAALQGARYAGLRRNADGDRVVSVSLPIRHVRAVLGVVTLEASDVDAIIARERAALIPFILIAIAVTLASSFLLNSLVAQPVLRMARAADRVRHGGARAISLPDLARRDDEVGDLTRSLEAMTQALSERMDAIESFAADVAHEIRNPLTSLRSAVETLDLVEEAGARERLLSILKNDVQRLDRLVTDISNASRLDAELSRDQPKLVDLNRLVGDVVSTYQNVARAGDVKVAFNAHQGLEAITVIGREGPLGQILRNLIDNARSFSPPGETVSVGLWRVQDEAIVTVSDNGPGIPPENLETVFQRFYTSRPKGSAFGGNSGLGLSIARQIAEAHGGTLRAENRTGAEGRVIGAMFTLVLPETGE
ncbi:stimulus-sensing domain-containing protein [Phenylobacterium sp.]|uniref:stimulus-sensing domain-containing protein n=1 Tax=Phenylobacterium sp. TaxID=1871053 RepID=UPI0025FE4420|nr:stimulus-sensing domain-containing protein [Phenylobacterium sp.]MBX3482821.1 sensor N-terminal transmembrane domain-containing protein [Phenylobacterium sp.]MCW5758557.1 sensor N-terminal transmembrane domain-containing protein [Phenylobacterium sp.]